MFTDSDVWSHSNGPAGSPDSDVTVQALPYPVVILCLDDILHTIEWPQCKDETCPCQEHPPYQGCDCGACTYVREVLAPADSSRSASFVD